MNSGQLSVAREGGPADYPTPPDRPASRIVFGFKVSPATRESLIEHIARTIAGRGREIVVSQNLHGLHTFFSNEAFRRLHAKAQVRIDGMPIVWLARLGGVKVDGRHRVAWLDLFWPLMTRAEREGWRVFYLGAKAEVLADGLQVVREALPGITIEGRDGYFDPDPESAETAAVIERIKAWKPDILIVGMGMPRQETWVLGAHERLEAPVIMTSGACIEYVAGAVPTPPRWLGRLGLEWLYRMLTNPKRFLYRYVVEPWETLWFLLTRPHGLSEDGGQRDRNRR